MTTPAAASKPLFSEAYKRWVIFVLMLMYFVNFIDRVIVGAVGEAIKRDLELTDQQMGMLGGLSFTILYVIVGFPAGRVTERVNRKTMLWIVMVIWSGATALCGVAQNFWQLLTYRAAVGIGEGGFTPPAVSMLSDYFEPHRRATAFSLVVLGIPLGSAVGLAGAGWVAQHYGWQAAFFVVGIPGLLLAVLVATTLREPPRGYSEGSHAVQAPTPSMRAAFTLLARKPTFWNLSCASGLANVIGYSFNIFLISYLVRAFGLSLPTAAGAVGLLTGLALAIGMVSGGFAIDFLGRRDVRWYGWAPAIGLVAALPFYVLAFSQQANWRLTVGLAFVAVILVQGFLQSTTTTNQSLVEPRMRGTTSALGSAINQTIGLAFGSVVVGGASDFFARRAFASTNGGDYAGLCDRHGAVGAAAEACSAASATGLQHAFLFCTLFIVWSAAHFLFASMTLKRDLAAKFEPAA